jgi:hypothetical protein
VDFDHRRSKFGGHLDLCRRRTNKQRYLDAGMFELAHHRRELVVLTDHIEATFGRALCAFFRHKANGVRPGLERNSDHFLGRGHLEIQRLADFRLKPRNIVIANVAAILAQMRRYSVAAGGNCELRRPHGVGMTATARVADRGNVIDVDAKAKTIHALAVHAFRLRHHGFGAQLGKDGGEMFEVIDLEINHHVGKIGGSTRHAYVVDISIMLGDDLRDLSE